MEKIYNKLVRDNIPKIIKDCGETPITYILEDDDYKICLNKKLKEEIIEYLENPCLEEFCDILEVMEAIALANNYSEKEVKELKDMKIKKNGAFKEKIFLEKVIK